MAGRKAGKRPAIRRRLLLGGWLFASVVVMVWAVKLQVVEGSEWRAEAERQHRKSAPIPAARGTILDRDGAPLAMSHETFRVSVAPHEVLEVDATIELLASALEISRRDAERALRPGRRWVVLPGRYSPTIREPLAGARGVYVERELRRFHPHGELVAGVLGAVIDGEGRGGVEQAFDSVLSGIPGQEIVARDANGRAIPGEAWVLREPSSGGEVRLTLDVELQEIAQEALSEAVEKTQAEGGDLLVTDPQTGEILAIASLRNGVAAGLSSLNTPYEPGSTLKPFSVAALLEHEVATLADSVDTGVGSWRTHGRTITDVSAIGKADLAHALRVSSNVGIAKFAELLTPAQHYEALRDFGFGTPTGLPIPGEAAGTLRRPAQWSRQSPASLAIGYEVAVTPVQMAMAYGALANGGILMEPRLVREVRGRDGELVRSWEPRAVRRAVSERVATELRQVLVDVVEGGTGTAARLTTFSVAGKSGTSRAYATGGGYERGRYYSSFVGFFPAEDPQLVVFVKLESPRGGSYYGGATAAPVTRATLEAVLAARRPPIDRRALAQVAHRPLVASAEQPVIRPASLELGGDPAEREPFPVEGLIEGFGLDEIGALSTDETFDEAFPLLSETARIPEVTGLAPRVAVRRLHAHGFRVEWDGRPGVVARTVPAGGSAGADGETVRLVIRSGR